jgi:adenylate cyclase
MPYLVANGPEASQFFRQEIPDREVLLIGRYPQNEVHVGWDPRVSRRHASLFWQDGSATINCVDGARNPIVFRGTSCQRIRIRTGDEFRIGSTLFRLVDDDPDSKIRRCLDDASIKDCNTSCGISTSDHRLTLISRYSQSLWLSSSEPELAAGLVSVLAEVIPHAATVALVRVSDVSRIKTQRPDVIQWDSRDKSERLLLSRPMLAAAVRQERTIVRVRSDDSSSIHSFAGDSGRWMICSPLMSAQSEIWCLSISGEFGSGRELPAGLTTTDLQGDVQVVDLLVQLASAIRRVRLLEDRFAGIRQFFSPAVAESVANASDASALAPTESETAVLFCDLRGYSRIAEQAGSRLQELLDRVNAALEVMTQNIISHDGVIADFQGDSALGFWGWPLKLENGPLPACCAALDILRIFRQAAARPQCSGLSDFRVGIGIACGTAIAGRIGTKQQAKVGVFGHVVNMGSRLEGMTKQIGVPLLVDGPTAKYVRTSLPASIGRCRRIGLIRPVGVRGPIDVSELLPPEEDSHIKNAHLEIFDGAVAAFESVNWDDAVELLSAMPARDRAKDFLLMQIASHNYDPPQDWDGVIRLTGK